MLEKPRPVLSVISALTVAIGPQRCSSMSNPWHCVSIRFACACSLDPGSPPKRQLANTSSPSVPCAIASAAIRTGRA